LARRHAFSQENDFDGYLHIPQRKSDIPEGNIGAVAANGKSKLLVVRGLADGLKGYLLLDDVSRNELNVHESSTHLCVPKTLSELMT
jgi:hypothetical protein